MGYKNKEDLYRSQKRRWNKQKIRAMQWPGEGKCFKCGRDDFHPAAYDFHHLDPNRKEVGWGKLRLRSWEKIQEELCKCILLCSNCHREHHADPDLW